MRRPRLEIRPSPWSPSGPVDWTFAAIQVHNKPLSAPFSRLLTREVAQGCVVDIDFFGWGTDERAMPTVPGRWSSHPEPIRSIPERPTIASALAETQVFTAFYDATMDPREHDVPVGHVGEEVAVAVLTRGEGAFAWGTASYAHPGWANPDWQLRHGTYRVVVRVRGSGLECEAAFKLEYLDDDFSKFVLQEIQEGSDSR